MGYLQIGSVGAIILATTHVVELVLVAQKGMKIRCYMKDGDWVGKVEKNGLVDKVFCTR